MSVIELKCPKCSGDLELEDSREFGFCRFCGAKIMISDMITQKISVEFRDTGKTDELIDLAFREWNSGDLESARLHVVKALESDSSNSRGWMLRCVIEGKDPKNIAKKLKNDEKSEVFAMEIIHSQWNTAEIIYNFFPDSESFASIRHLSKTLATGMNWESGETICIHPRDLETGWSSYCNKRIEEYRKSLDIIESLKTNEDFSKFLQTIQNDKLVSRLNKSISNFEKMKESALQFQEFRLNFVGLFSPKYYYNNVQKEFKKSKDSQFSLECGKHEFRRSDNVTVIYIPIMPKAILVEAPRVDYEYNDSSTKTYTDYKLIEFPQYRISIRSDNHHDI